MNTPRNSLPLAMLLLMVSLATSFAGGQDQPTYQGKPLSHWIKQLESSNLDQRQDAAVTLDEHIGPEGAAAVPALTAVLSDPDSIVSSRAAGALKRIGPAAAPAVPDLIAVLKDAKRDFITRSHAAEALGAIGPKAKAAVPVLMTVLEEIDAGVFVRASAAEGLGGIGPDATAAIPALVKALTGADTILAGSVVDALGHMGAEAAPALAKLYQDYPAGGIGRGMVAAALKNLGPQAKAAVPTLIQVLKKDADDRWQTTTILAQIGLAAKEAIPALLDATKDDDAMTREGAAYALNRIDPMAAAKAGIAEPPMRYDLFLNSSKEYYDTEDLGIGGGEDIGGPVMVWLNGDPISRFGGAGGQWFGLGPWLQDGKNELALSGKHKKPAYALIAHHQAHNFQGKPDKKIFDGPGGDQLGPPLVFTVEKAALLPPREVLSARPDDRKQYEKEIRNFLADVKTLIAAHDGAKAAARLTGGMELWQGPVLGVTAKEAQDDRDKLAKALSDPKLKVVTDEPKLTFVFGRRLVWVEVASPGDKGLFLITLEQKGERSGPSVLQFARVAGNWVIWHAPGGVRLSLGTE